MQGKQPLLLVGSLLSPTPPKLYLSSLALGAASSLLPLGVSSSEDYGKPEPSVWWKRLDPYLAVAAPVDRSHHSPTSLRGIGRNLSPFGKGLLQESFRLQASERDVFTEHIQFQPLTSL